MTDWERIVADFGAMVTASGVIMSALMMYERKYMVFEPSGQFIGRPQTSVDDQ